MKSFLATLLLVVALTPALMAQGPSSATSLLKGPSDWRPENIPIPPPFAPDVKLHGAEEARFAPGMFATASSNYFTYAVAIAVDEKPELTASELKDFLEKYYRGLCVGVGRRKQLSPDVSQIVAAIEPAKSASEKTKAFSGKIPFFDTFNDGRKITLNLEITVRTSSGSKKQIALFLISPQAPDSPVWKSLREIESAHLNSNVK